MVHSSAAWRGVIPRPSSMPRPTCSISCARMSSACRNRSPAVNMTSWQLISRATRTCVNGRAALGKSRGRCAKTAPRVTDKFKSEVESDRLDAQFDIAAAALIGGLTNSLTIASGVGNPYFSVKFTGLGIDIGKHMHRSRGKFQRLGCR